MSDQTDLHLALSHALNTDDLSLEHDTMFIPPELTKQICDALRDATVTAASGATPVVELGRTLS